MEALERAIKRAGSQARLGESLKVSQPTVSEWLNSERPIPQDRSAEIERLYGEPCEQLRPDLVWVRVPDPDWPNGRPCVDVAAPASAAKASKPEPLVSLLNAAMPPEKQPV